MITNVSVACPMASSSLSNVGTPKVSLPSLSPSSPELKEEKLVEEPMDKKKRKDMVIFKISTSTSRVRFKSLPVMS